MVDNDFEGKNILILLDKDSGMTSFACDSKIKKLLHTKKVGHLGTLDPFATGLLPLCVGKGLRYIRFADDYDKTYECVCVFGKTTDTLDVEGEVTGGKMPTSDELKDLISSDFKVVRDAFEKMTKITSQVPPKYSAKKINGKKAYELAREGKEVELKPHPVTIYSIDIKSVDVVDETIEVDFVISCSKGTYIRTICDDVGREVGFGAYAKSLRRIKCGPFDVSDAYTVDAVEKMMETSDLSFIKDASMIVDDMPELKLNEVQTSMVKCGKKLDVRPFKEITSSYASDTFYKATFNGEVIAVMYVSEEDGRLRIERMLA